MGATVLLATEDRISGDALSSVLDRKGYEVFLQYENPFHIDRLLETHHPSIVIFAEPVVSIIDERSYPIQESDHQAKSVFILSSETSGLVVKGLKIEIDGFVHKESGLEDLLVCIQALEEGCTYISPALSGKITRKSSDRKTREVPVALTEREKQIIELVKENKTSKEIGRDLNLSYKTIQNHRQNICNKLGLKGRNKLYEYAVNHS